MRLMFGDCVLDPDRRELRRGPEVVAMGPQVFDLLLFLVANRDRVVSRDDLLEALPATSTGKILKHKLAESLRGAS